MLAQTIMTLFAAGAAAGWALSMMAQRHLQPSTVAALTLVMCGVALVALALAIVR